MTPSEASPYRVLGIRHHGPGSAAALQRALPAARPDLILVEGPPEGSKLIPWLAHPQMVLPAALLVYRPDQPQTAAYYPYTDFSPETLALRYALQHGVPARFADLPQAQAMAAGARAAMPRQEVFQRLAQAAGHRSYEAWWNLAVEQRRDSRDLFAAVLELMAALREEPAGPEAADDAGQLWAARREASMRQALRSAMAEGHRRIVFVCGAWHAPALLDLGDAEGDAALLDGLDEAAVEATWVPWTYSRLSMSSGYGAGIRSPGWYDHLWRRGQAGDSLRQAAAGWLARVAELLRGEGFSASPANVIEAVRLAEALAAMRHLPFPGLPELNEASIAVLGEGRQEQMALIRSKLIVGERLGLVPPDTPMVPLQRDLLRQQQELELHPDPEAANVTLDLRRERDLARSRLLHRLRLLGVPWGEPLRRRGPQQAAQESWTLQWQAGFPVRLIEAGMWGNTVEAAAAARAADQASAMQRLGELTKLLDRVLLAGLWEAVDAIVKRIEDESAVSSDIPQLMAALPPLARILRYGSARRTDQRALQQLVESMLTRICIGLPSTCAGMDDEAAQEMAGRLSAVTASVHTLRETAQAEAWHGALLAVLEQPGVHGMLDGRASRLLLDDDALTAPEAARRMERALRRGSAATTPVEQAAQSAAWLDGFLEGSELLLIHDRRLWGLLDSFLTQLPEQRFVEVLPLLRRAFARYSEAARRQLQERARLAPGAPSPEMPAFAAFDHERAEAVLPLLQQLILPPEAEPRE